MINAVPYAYQTTVVSQKLFDEHITLYNLSVAKANEVIQKLTDDPGFDSANALYSRNRALKKSETFAINAVILHELYFQNLMTNAQANTPGKKMRHLLDRYWGGYEKWREDFTACAKSARGWALCVYEQRSETCRNIILDTHDEGMIVTAYPLAALDVYEHAYIADYATDRTAYINRFINNIPWDVIEKRATAVVG